MVVIEQATDYKIRDVSSQSLPLYKGFDLRLKIRRRLKCGRRDDIRYPEINYSNAFVDSACIKNWGLTNIADILENSLSMHYDFNPLGAKRLRENINIYLHFMSFLHTNKKQVAK